MTKREREYFKWLRYLKEQDLMESGHYGLIPVVQKGGVIVEYNFDGYDMTYHKYPLPIEQNPEVSDTTGLPKEQKLE